VAVTHVRVLLLRLLLLLLGLCRVLLLLLLLHHGFIQLHRGQQVQVWRQRIQRGSHQPACLRLLLLLLLLSVLAWPRSKRSRLQRGSFVCSSNDSR
jgi:hypothetical protein